MIKDSCTLTVGIVYREPSSSQCCLDANVVVILNSRNMLMTGLPLATTQAFLLCCIVFGIGTVKVVQSLVCMLACGCIEAQLSVKGVFVSVLCR